MNLTSKLSVFTAVLLSCFVLCCSMNSDPIKPPRGYANETLLKIAYGLGFLKLIDTEPDIPTELKVYEDLVYKTIDTTLLNLDIYKLKNQKEKVPVLIFIHGGSWSGGKRSDYLPYLVDYAMKGFVTVTVSYRLVGVAKYPAAVEDVKCAIKWIKDNAEKYGIDPSRVALIGGSAGGHLAMMAGYDSNSELNECQSSANGNVQVVVNLYGPTDFTTPYARGMNQVINFLGKSYEEVPELYIESSPKTYISPNSPPTLIFHGTLDSLVPISQSDSLNRWLENAGVVHEYHRLKGWPHTMDLSKKVNKYCQYYIDGFLKEHL